MKTPIEVLSQILDEMPEDEFAVISVSDNAKVMFLESHGWTWDEFVEEMKRLYDSIRED